LIFKQNTFFFTNKNFWFKILIKNKMGETKRYFSKKEIQENGLVYIKECLKNSNFKEISFDGK
jgi:hypothetical protein